MGGIEILYNEAIWLNNLLKSEIFLNKTTLINIGCSTQDFIDSQQPYIQDFVLSPINKLFKKVVNVDIKDGPGVDFVGDFLQVKDQVKLMSMNPDVVLMSNLLEHIPNPKDGLTSIARIMPKGSLLILTGPRRYPYHPDPIDNGYRPSKHDLMKDLSDEFEVINIEIVKSGTALTANLPKENRTVAYKWMSGNVNFINLIKDPIRVLRIVKHSIFPVAAYCCLLQRK